MTCSAWGSAASRRMGSAAARLLDSGAGRRSVRVALGLLHWDRSRGPMVRIIRTVAMMFLRARRGHGGCDRMDRERELFALAVTDTIDRLVAGRAMSREFTGRAGSMAAAMFAGLMHDSSRGRFRLENGVDPPLMVVISPTGSCNLSCAGCYSGWSAPGDEMPFEELERLVEEARGLWGIRLVAFSGGEPLLYGRGSKGILDVIERNSDMLFLVFTNGTLVDRRVARRLAASGNAMLAFSVEGLERSTDARRGTGTFAGVMRALSELKDAGAPAGISVTATRDNCEEILSDEFIDFFFRENLVFFEVLFQYVPQGRDPNAALMPTPEQRLRMWQRSWEIIEERKVFVFDFWNHGTLVGGCMAAGRERGYLHVDWEGNVCQCVFVPYSAGNIYEVHSLGGTLEDIWASPFMSGLRSWQRLRATGDAACEVEPAGPGMVCACPVRDHYADFRELVLSTGATPIGASAAACLSSPTYTCSMVRHGREFAELSRPVLEAEYACKPGPEKCPVQAPEKKNRR